MPSSFLTIKIKTKHLRGYELLQKDLTNLASNSNHEEVENDDREQGGDDGQGGTGDSSESSGNDGQGGGGEPDADRDQGGNEDSHQGGTDYRRVKKEDKTSRRLPNSKWQFSFSHFKSIILFHT